MDLPAPPSPPPQAPAPKTLPPKKIAPGFRHKYVYAGVGGGAVLLMLIAAALYSRGSHKPAATPTVAATTPVHLRSTPAGAQISVNGTPCGTSTCELQLAPGEYRAQATLADYQPASATFTIASGQNTLPEVALTLLATPALVTLSTDLTDGSVMLDRAQYAQIQGSDIEIAKLAPGSHTIFVQNGAFRSSLTLEIADGAQPKLAGPIQTQGMNGFVVVHSGTDGKVYSNVSDAEVSLDGKTVGTLSADGLDLHDLSAGAHQLVLESPAAHASLAFNGGAFTSILASLVTNQNLSVLDILTHEDDVAIFLNNDKYRGTTRQGRVRIYLSPKNYSVRVQKEGFSSPPEKSVELKKGQSSQLDFTLTAARSTLAVHHGVAGSEVRVDGNSIGVVRSDGEFSAAYIEPGKHVISLRHDRYKPLESEQVFVGGKTIDLEGAMHGLFGTLKIEVNPPTAGVRIRRQGETQDREVKETSLSLPEGTYTLTASAPRFQDATTTAHVIAENTISANLVLKPVGGKAGRQAHADDAIVRAE